jgi:hypothetical protein
MSQPIHLRTKIFVSLIFCFALVCVTTTARAGKKNKSDGGGGQFSQTHQRPVARPTVTPKPTPTPTPKPKATPKPTPASHTEEGDKQHRTAKGKKGKSSGPDTTSSPATAGSSPSSGTPTATATPLAGPQGLPTFVGPRSTAAPVEIKSVGDAQVTPLATPTATPFTTRVTQLPTPTFTPFTVPTSTAAPQTTTTTTAIVPITTMSGQAIKVDPNANQSAQSAVSVSDSNAVTNPTATGIQGQVVTGAPTSPQTRAPVPLAVTGGEQFGTVHPSNFQSVSVTDPNGAPWNYNGWNGNAVQNPLDSQFNQNNQIFHVEPSALIRQTQRSDQNADN